MPLHLASFPVLRVHEVSLRVRSTLLSGHLSVRKFQIWFISFKVLSYGLFCLDSADSRDGTKWELWPETGSSFF